MGGTWGRVYWSVDLASASLSANGGVLVPRDERDLLFTISKKLVLLLPKAQS